jgi:hypothetical protein
MLDTRYWMLESRIQYQVGDLGQNLNQISSLRLTMQSYYKIGDNTPIRALAVFGDAIEVEENGWPVWDKRENYQTETERVSSILELYEVAD